MAITHSTVVATADDGVSDVGTTEWNAGHVNGDLGLPLALTGAVTATRYVGGTALVAPTTGTFAVGDFVVTANGKVYVCTTAGSPGTWLLATNSTPQTLTLYGTAGTWTDQPSATTEFLGVTSHRHQYDFTAVTQARFKARINTAGVSGAYIRPQYSTDDSTYAVLANTTTDFDLSMTATGTKRSAWANIVAGAKIDPCYIRIVGADGNATADPVIAMVELEVR